MTIKEMRVQAGMTQKDFAEYIGCSKRAVEDWEGERRECPEYVKGLIQYKLEHEGRIRKDGSGAKKMYDGQLEFVFDGRRYVLLQDAYADGPADDGYFTAMAICREDVPDERGFQPAYSVRWYTWHDYDIHSDGDAGDACDWAHPVWVEEDGAYNREWDEII